MNYDNSSQDQPACVLLCGKVDPLEYETIRQVARFYNVIITGESLNSDILRRKVSRKIHIYREEPTSENFSKLIYSFSPDVIWYFSGYIDGGNGLDNENKKLEALVECCKVNDIKKLVVISSINSLNYTKTLQRPGMNEAFVKDEGVPRYVTQTAHDCAAFEELVDYATSKNNIKTVLLRVPFITGRTNSTSYLGSLFSQMINKKSVEFPYNERQLIDFLSTEDLIKLLISVTEETLDEASKYTVFSGYDHRYGELGESLVRCDPSVTVKYERPSVYEIDTDKESESRRLRVNYGFIARDDVLRDIEASYEAYKRAAGHVSPFREKLQGLLARLTGKTVKAAELVILFVLVQVLLRYTSDSVYFRYVDLRLFYVVIMGVTHGMLTGMTAGVLECISLIFEYAATGVTGTMLFYNVDYWLPFAIYIMTGSITGYLTSTRENKLKFMEEESFALQDKYLFLNDVYMSVIDNKEEYKRQILGYQDSFGKIFETVEKLDSSMPADIFMNGVDTLERILNNHSIAIYTMDDYQKYLRLVACSREMSNKLTNSVSIEDFRIIYDTLLNSETWKNTEFIEGLPAYAYGIVENRLVRLMIVVFDASPEQLGLYYMNLFTIMCNLIKVSFKRALEYQEAIEDEKFCKGTEILLPEYFEKELDSQRRMADAGVASYILIEIVAGDVMTFDSQIRGLIRHSDYAGIGTDGKPYVLFTQTTRDIFEVVGKRLKEHEVEYIMVEGM